MRIPPLGSSQIPPSQFSPQHDLKELVENVDQIVQQMSQNRGNVEMLMHLRDEYLQTVEKMNQLLPRLPVSSEENFKTHLQDLKIQMKRLFDTLVKGGSYESIHLDTITVSSAIALLRNDASGSLPRTIK